MSNVIELVLKAKDDVSSVLDKVTDGLDSVDSSAGKAGKSLGDVAGGGGGRALVSMRGLVGAAGATAAGLALVAAGAVKAALELGELAGEGQRNIQALNALGPAWRQVQAATNDTVTATEAYRSQQTLLRSGLRVSGAEFAALARYAREHKDVNETAAEAVQRFAEALREGDAGGLRQFGISIAEGSTRAQAFERSMRRVTAANASGAPVQRTLAEDTSRLSTALGEVSSATANWIAQGIGLQNFLSEAGTRVRQLTEDINFLVEAQSRDAGTGTSAGEARIAAMRQYSETLRAVGRNLDEVGQRGALRQLTVNPLRLSTDQLRAYTARLRELQTRTGAFGQAVNAQGALAPAMSGNLTDLPAGTTLASLARDRNRQARVYGAADVNRDIRSLNAEAQRQLDEQEAARRAAAGQQGPRDAAAAPTPGAPLRAAQLELGVQNQALALLGQRFRALGQVIDQEERLARLQDEAARTGADVGENEAARLARVAAARGALVQALTEERDRRREVTQAQRAEAATAAGNALGALQAARGGGQLTQSQSQALSGFQGARDRLAGVVADQRREAAELAQTLAAANLPLTEQVRLRQQLTQVLSEQVTNEQTLASMDQRSREASQARLALTQAEYDAQAALVAAAQQARDAGTALTQSETDALRNRTNMLATLTELERGYQALITQTTAEAQAAQTEEVRNAALTRRIQLLGQLGQVENQRRNYQNEEARRDPAAQLSRRWNAALQSQTTQAERFGDAVASTFTGATDAFANHILAVAEGKETFGEAMEGMLKEVLAMIAKRAIVEALVSTALGIGALASFNYPAAAGHFAAAGAWAVAGAAAAGGMALLADGSGGGGGQGAGGGASAAPTAPASSSAPASTGSGDGGGLTLNINVNGAMFNEGVEDSVVRAIDRAALRGRYPRFIRRQ